MRDYLKILLASLHLLMLCSCTKNDSQPDSEVMIVKKNTIFDDKFLSILDQYEESTNCKICINIIYIDKIEPHKTIITIKSIGANLDYLNNNPPLMYFYHKDIVYFVFTGIEDYFKPINDYSGLFNIQDNEKCASRTWQVIDSMGGYRILKQIGYPFFPLPSKFADADSANLDN